MTNTLTNSAPLTLGSSFSRVPQVTGTAWDLESFARDCDYAGPPFRWDEERRFLLRAELDAAFFHLYGLNRDDTAYILDTFPIVRRKDEGKYNGDYRTKRVILEIYDAMQESIRTGQPYQTRLDPPPGPPAEWEVAISGVGSMEVRSQLRWVAPDWPPGTPQLDNWPSHIHTPKQRQAEPAKRTGEQRV